MANIIQIVGLAAIIAGATLIAIPAGLIVGGIACVLIGIALERD